MNEKTQKSLDEYTTFRLLCEVEGDAALSQRELARRLDSALGLVNAYLKVAAGKGWIKIKELPANRSTYHLTAKGQAERKRLALHHTRYLHQLVTVIRDEYRPLCNQLRDEGVERVALCGVDGIAEIVWLALHEAGIDISLVMDTRAVGSTFMGRPVISLAHAMLSGMYRVMISSRIHADELYHALLDLGVDPLSIKVPPLFLEKKYAA